MQNLQKVSSKKLQSFNNSLTHFLELKDKAALLKLERKDVPETLKKEIASTKFQILIKLVDDLEIGISEEDLKLASFGDKDALRARFASDLFKTQREWHDASDLPPKEEPIDHSYSDTDTKSICVLDSIGNDILYDFKTKKWYRPMRDFYGYEESKPPKKWCLIPEYK